MEQKNNIKQNNKKNWIQRNWSIILMCLFLVFGMSQCMSRCSKNGKINMQETTITQKDSIIDNLNTQIDTLKFSLNYYTALFESERNHNSNFASIATGNQSELYSKINSLEAQIATLENRLRTLSAENKKLSDSIKTLNK